MAETYMQSAEGYILTPAGWVKGVVIHDRCRILRIAGVPVLATDTPPGPYIIPGLIDLHVHGGDGVEYSDGEAGIRRFIRFHARRGTVALAPTTGTAPVAEIEQALTDIERVRQNRESGEPTVLGAHLDATGLLWTFQTVRSLNEDWGDLTAAAVSADWGDLTAATEFEDRMSLT